MKKVLVLYPYPLENDGLSIQGYYLAKGLKELGIKIKSCDKGDNERKEKLYKEFKPDVVIGIGFWGDTPNLILHPLKFGMIPVPWLNANGWVANYHETLENLPLIIATSNWVKSTYMRDRLTGNNISVSSIGFDPKIFYPRNSKRNNIRKSLEIKDNEIMLLTAGGDVTSKGAQEMFKALGKLKGKFDNWKYVLKTFPSFSAEDHGKFEKELIEKLGFDKNKFIYISDSYSPKKMASLINACDIYCAPSRLEGFGMIQLEAQACGKPVISINVGGPKDIILHEKTGYLVDVEHEIKLESEWVYEHMGFDKKKRIHFPIPKTFAYKANTDQLADCLLKLFNDVKLRHKMGEEAAKHALEKFHYKFIAAKINKIIDENIN